MFDSQIRRNIKIALFFANMGIVAFGRCLFVGFFLTILDQKKRISEQKTLPLQPEKANNEKFSIMIIGIIVAMEKEFVQLRTLLDEASTERHNRKDFVVGQMGNNTIVMQQCGIGKVNAAIGAVEMIDHYQPDLVISTGVAGGADVGMNIMDVVVSTECTYHDVYCGPDVAYGQLIGTPARFRSPKELIDKACNNNATPAEGGAKAAAGSVATVVHPGLIVTGDWFVDKKEKMQAILEKFPEAKAVDMESCAIAHTCHIYGVPFVSFRIISDIPLKDTDASQYFDFWARLAEGSFRVTKQFVESL